MAMTNKKLQVKKEIDNKLGTNILNIANKNRHNSLFVPKEK